jgi:hypothetical protein
MGIVMSLHLSRAKEASCAWVIEISSHTMRAGAVVQVEGAVIVGNTPTPDDNLGIRIVDYAR